MDSSIATSCKQVEEFTARYERGETTLNVQLLNFLRDWLANHIQIEDKQYGPCVKMRRPK